MTEQEKQKLREWNDAAKPNDRERDIPTKWIDALLDENAQLKSDIAVITQEHSANNADLMRENATLVVSNNRLTREIEKLNFEDDALKEWCGLVNKENATLKEQLDIYKDAFGDHKQDLKNLHDFIQSRKELSWRGGECVVDVALDYAVKLEQQNARLVAMLERIGGYARHDEGCNYPFNPAYGCKCLLVDVSVKLGNLLKEVKNGNS